MKVLAIETACPPGSIALWGEDGYTALCQLEHTQRTTETFAIVIQSMLTEARWLPADIELVATTDGPGSFTGLRIAITAAKIFAYVTGARIVGVNTLELIAQQAPTDGEVEVVVDAQRGELFTARFRKQGSVCEQLVSTQILAVDPWLNDRATTADLLIGPGLRKIEARISKGVRLASRETWQPRADTLAAYAARKSAEGLHADIWTLIPNYFRRSAAEEKADRAGE